MAALTNFPVIVKQLVDSYMACIKEKDMLDSNYPLILSNGKLPPLLRHNGCDNSVPWNISAYYNEQTKALYQSDKERLVYMQNYMEHREILYNFARLSHWLSVLATIQNYAKVNKFSIEKIITKMNTYDDWIQIVLSQHLFYNYFLADIGIDGNTMPLLQKPSTYTAFVTMIANAEPINWAEYGLTEDEFPKIL
uniref:Uncharacterized protein n=1 Tax=viral metagenome TaxID=1070528 RepID=A0A6C0HLI5_9ZZZZ